MRRLITLTSFLSFCFLCYPQMLNNSFTDSIISRFSTQLEIFPQEKIHIQTDKSDYVSGESIWTRFFLTDAVLHKPTTASRYIYAELISPMDSVISRVKIRPVDSMYYGYIPIPDNLPEGDYTLRAYTHFMRSLNDSYFHKKTIRIGHPLSSSIKTDIQFIDDKEQKLKLKIKFIDLETNKQFQPDNFKIQFPNTPLKSVKVKDDGIAYISFDLSNSLKHNSVYFEVTKQKQTYTQYVQIPISGEDFDVSFFPEGGYMVAQSNCQIAFKALNANGLSEDVEGDLFDNEGEKITSLKSLHLGMGSFNFIPIDGKSYYAIIRNRSNISKRFELPPLPAKSHSLKVEWRKENLAVSVLQTKDGLNSQPLYLVIHSRGVIQYANLWDNRKEFIFIPSKQFPSGILQVLLIDSNMNILSERLTFCTNEDQAKVSFQSNKPNYTKREVVNGKIKITDAYNKPLQGTFSIAVTDDNDVSVDTCQNILSNLLLSSELKGYIESPAYYFRKEDRFTSTALDLLMLTQGWRRYNIPDVIKGKFQYPSSPIELGQQISGSVTSWVRDKPSENGLVGIFSPNNSYFNTSIIDDEGRFYFNGFEMSDSTQYIIRALSKKGDKYVKLKMDEEEFPKVGLPIPLHSIKKEEEKSFLDYIVKSDMKYTMENGIRSIFLSEAKVTALAKTRKDEFDSFFLKYADKTITITDTENQNILFVEDFFRLIPELQTRRVLYTAHGVTNKFINKFTFRGGFPIVVIDDTPMISDFDIDEINIFEVASIGFIRPPKSGSIIPDGGNGAVIITTKRGAPKEKKDMNIASISPLGYQQTVEFYSPKYETKEQKNDNTPDLRSTIYWKPDGKTSTNGEANIDFYTADSSEGSYSVAIEGISDEGKIFHTIEKISIKE